MSFYPSEKSKELNSLNDVNVTTPTNGDLLQYNSADDKWANSSDVWDTMAIMGAKNAFPYNPSWLNARYGGVYSYSNGTYTVQTNTTEYSGMYISHSNMRAHFGNYFKGSWILSFEYKGDASFTGLIGEVSHTVSQITTSFQKYTATISDITQIDDIYFYSRDTSSAHTITVKNLMIRPVSDANDTFADYAPTNKECMSYAVNSKLGAHNLLNVTAVTQTLNGVTYTIDENKVITINTNGTLSANKELRIKDVLVDDILVGGKSYIFTINQGAENPDKVGGYVDYRTADDTGWENGILVDTPFTHLEGRKYGVWITLAAGANYSNLKVYPMITAVEDTDKSFAPFAPTNHDLMYVKKGWQKNGSYNLAPCTLLNNVVQGVTYTIDSKNIVTATWSSTPTSTSFVAYCNQLTNHLTAGKTYKLTGCPVGGSWSTGAYKYRLYVYDITASGDACVDIGNGATFTPQSGHEYNMWIAVGINAAASGSLIFKPMITTDLNATYDDYEPYAMTNQELTLKELYNSNNISVYRQGNIVIAHFRGVAPKNIADLNFANIGAKPKIYIPTFQCRCDGKPTTIEINANGTVENIGYYASYGSSYTDLKTNTTTAVSGTITYIAE